jgi:hypothetical protein
MTRNKKIWWEYEKSKNTIFVYFSDYPDVLEFEIYTPQDKIYFENWFSKFLYDYENNLIELDMFIDNVKENRVIP